MKSWLNYFETNRTRRRTIPWTERIALPARVAVPFIRSLQRFQIGESGDGRSLRTEAAATGDPDYARAIALFVGEEQEHARLMAEILKRMGAPLLEGHWSDHCFILLRRLFGLKEHLLVLLVPEIIAQRYFGMLRDRIEEPAVRAVCDQILHDEEGHVAFHVEYLRRAFEHRSVLTRYVARSLWRLVFRVTVVVLLIDHRSLLRALGESRGRFWWDCELMFDDVAARIFAFARASERSPGPREERNKGLDTALAPADPA